MLPKLLFRSNSQLLVRGSPVLRPPPDGTNFFWRLISRGDDVIDVTELREPIDRPKNIVVFLKERNSTRTFSYLRALFSLGNVGVSNSIRAEIDLTLHDAPGILLLMEFYVDQGLTRRVGKASKSCEDASGVTTMTLELAINAQMLSTSLYCILQVCLLSNSGARVVVGDTRIWGDQNQESKFQLARFKFDSFGDVSKASSRLRVWKFIDELKKEGHFIADRNDNNVDVYVAQKVRSFEAVRAIRTNNPLALIVYDFDDNYFIPEQGVLSDLLAFVNMVDVVTCGSEYLADVARQWHHNVYVLDNPLDVDSLELRRQPTRRLVRCGWFGAPENLWELKCLNITRKVETVTRDGDIEYVQEEIDEILAGFDLLLFPVTLTPWSLAKNANRMMKALSLGVPVLMTDSPEHRRIAETIGLPSASLIPVGQDWNDAISSVEEDFQAFEEACLRARWALQQEYATRPIMERWWEFLVQSRYRALVPTKAAEAKKIATISVLVVDYQATTAALQATLCKSRLPWDAFREVTVISPHLPGNLLGQFTGIKFVNTGSYMSVFPEADRSMRNISGEFVLVLSSGCICTHGMLRQLEEAIEYKELSLLVFSSTYQFNAAQSGLLSTIPLRELITQPRALFPLLISKDWSRRCGASWDLDLSLYGWSVVVRSLASDKHVVGTIVPVAYHSIDDEQHIISREFSNWLSIKDAVAARELPAWEAQWRRKLNDIVSRTVHLCLTEVSSALALVVGENFDLRRQVKAAQSELRKLKGKEKK